MNPGLICLTDFTRREKSERPKHRSGSRDRRGKSRTKEPEPLRIKPLNPRMDRRPSVESHRERRAKEEDKGRRRSGSRARQGSKDRGKSRDRKKVSENHNKQNFN